MMSDLHFYIQQFSKEVQSWEQRYKTDKNDRLLSHYTIMSQTLREKAKLLLTPVLTELQQLADEYGDKYRHKDLPYHITSAKNTATFLKTLLKELVDLYEHQAPYDQITIRWDYNLASLKKRIIDLNARLTVIEKILATELTEENKT